MGSLLALLVLTIAALATFIAAFGGSSDGSSSDESVTPSDRSPARAVDASGSLSADERASAEPAAAPPWARVSRAQVAEAKRRSVPVTFENAVGMRFVLIPSGRFDMGSPADEAGRTEQEQLHPVTLRDAFYLGVTEVTNAQYRRFRADHGSGESWGRSLDADDQPVVNVSHEDAEAFLAWLRTQDGDHEYRLPSEAEWERAARGGTSTPYWWGGSVSEAARHANLADASAAKSYACTWGVAENDGFAVTAPVASYDPNPFGLYDILGNAFEWCEDRFADYLAPAAPLSEAGDVRVARGGSWNECPTGLRAAHRLRGPSKSRMPFIGFRVAASAGPATAPSPRAD